MGWGAPASSAPRPIKDEGEGLPSGPRDSPPQGAPESRQECLGANLQASLGGTDSVAQPAVLLDQ